MFGNIKENVTNKKTKWGGRNLTTDAFIAKAREKHGGKYDYSKVRYTDSQTKITIICPEHGEFEQIPNNHLSGKGCPKCGGVAKLTTDEFIARSRNVHGDKYDYSKVRYVNARCKVTIICPEHGEFEQKAGKHLSGQGCPNCVSFARSTTDMFVMKARKVHGDKYDYSKVKYVNGKTKVTIICPEHGEFEQMPSSHLKGHGCVKCGFEMIRNARKSGAKQK